MSYFKNPTFGIDGSGTFGQTGANLSGSPFGGPALNIGGFAGANAGYGGMGGGFDLNRASGLLGLANMGLGMMGMSNTNRSFEQMQQTGGLMRDIDFGTNIFAQNKDIFEQKDAPRYAAKLSVNDPSVRQFYTQRNLPELAGRYGRFGAFLA